MALFSGLTTALSYTLIIGVVLFAVGVIWLFYENVKLNSEFNNDYANLTNKISYATVIALIGVLVFGYAGLASVAFN